LKQVLSEPLLLTGWINVEPRDFVLTRNLFDPDDSIEPVTVEVPVYIMLTPTMDCVERKLFRGYVPYALT
jgi:hypothetical protein